ncbi:hypothetical protein D3C72_2397980 [compost metagenome]
MARYRLAVGALAFAGKPIKEIGSVSNFTKRFREWFALFGRHYDGEIMRVVAHQLAPFTQDLPAFGWKLVAPF